MSMVLQRRLKVSSEQAFDVIGWHVRENHPRWETEVLEIKPLDSGPIRVGSRATMVRKDFGKVTETTYEVTEFDPPHRIAIRHLDGPLDFVLAFTLADTDDGGSVLTVRVDAKPRGRLGFLGPLMERARRRTGDRLADQMVRVIEETASAPATAVPAGPATT
jgi:uncharacterized protein YndB with AHSA1/START domain